MKKRKRDNHDKLPAANIKVVGIGGGGGNAVSRMIKDFPRGVDFVAINTDHQDLDQCVARRKIYIGRNLTRGLGTGMNPDLGRQAAEENRSDIAEALEGADLVFIAAGLGGGTGTGASPIVAEVAKQIGALALAFVTKPFAFEGSQRSRIAQEGLIKLKDKVDALVVIPNDRIFNVISKETSIIKAFEAIDDVLKNALRGIVELIVTPGLINVDFADVRSVVQDAGSAIVGLGIGSGEGRAANAVNQALNSPLLETSVEGARGILLGISGSRKLGMNDINEVAKMVAQIADPSARIIFGAYYDRHLRANQLKVTLIATGFDGGVPASSLFSSSFREREISKQSFFGSSEIKGQSRLEEVSSGKSNPAKTPLVEGQPLKKSELAEAKKKESDVWDIPTFLRKKRK